MEDIDDDIMRIPTLRKISVIHTKLSDNKKRLGELHKLNPNVEIEYCFDSNIHDSLYVDWF